MLWVELLAGGIVPALMLLSVRIRTHARWLLAAALLVVFGVVLNRVNVFIVAYQPPFAERAYYPTIGEFAVTLGLIAGLILCYRLAVTYLPVMDANVRRA